MSIDLRMNLADDLLLYTDKITMHHSIECRVPLLDLDLIRFVESLPYHHRRRHPSRENRPQTICRSCPAAFSNQAQEKRLCIAYRKLVPPVRCGTGYPAGSHIAILIIFRSQRSSADPRPARRRDESGETYFSPAQPVSLDGRVSRFACTTHRQPCHSMSILQRVPPMTDYVPDSLSILGVGVSMFDSYDDAAQLIRRRISLRRRTFCVAVNPEKVQRANNNAKVKRALEAAHIHICDGMGVSVASRLLYGRRVPRCTGIDLFMRLVRLSAEEGWKIFLLGASPEANKAACQALTASFPTLTIAGRQDGFFKDNDAVVEQINSSGANLLFVALGSPRQELWINENMPRLRPSFFMGIGGSLDVVGGSAKRAPALFCKLGAEWLFRLLAQPTRLARQTALPLFALEILKAALWGGRAQAKDEVPAGAS